MKALLEFLQCVRRSGQSVIECGYQFWPVKIIDFDCCLSDLALWMTQQRLGVDDGSKSPPKASELTSNVYSTEIKCQVQCSTSEMPNTPVEGFPNLQDS